ncbi:MAG: thermosome subunit [archaeon]|nr:thermosome subunit [archaeon]MCP8314501.1 thermosome subunit [archaeon]MCP8316964.1 thermosome subunit [archaeon]MCP8320042.1 thermosome subunit [archaeon]
MSLITASILKEGTVRARETQMNNIDAARIISGFVRTTLGPCGMDKMLITTSGDETLTKIPITIVTNDGAEILKNIDVQHPVAKILVEVAKAQDSEVGDGTTSAVVLAGELLNMAQKLMKRKIHPNIIIEGYKKAFEKAKEILNDIAIEVDKNDDEMLKKVAITSMGGKNVAMAKEHLADIAVKAVKQIAEERDGKIKADIDNIKILKKHGQGLKESELVKGMVVEREYYQEIESQSSRMPERVENAKIILVRSAFDLDRGAVIFAREMRVEKPEQLTLFIDGEKKILKDMVEKIASAGANVLFCEKALDDVAIHYLIRKGIMAMKRVKEKDMERIAKAIDARIVSHMEDIGPDAIGEAGMVEEVKVGESKLIYIRDCKDPHALTILLRGGAEHVVDEAKRSIHDALCVVRNVLEDGKIVAGGGSPEAELSRQIRSFATNILGREQLAVEAFADALEVIPTALAENAGLDPIDILVELRAKHEKSDNSWYGVDVFSGKIEDMRKLNVLEPLRVKQQMIKSAVEATCMILRIDEAVCAKTMEEKEEGLEERLKEREKRISGKKRRWKQSPVWVPR